MKKNLRRITLLALALMAIGRTIYAAEAATTPLFSGYMKFVFIGVAVIVLVLILFLSYKLDKEEPLVDNEGAVSKKKLGPKAKNKTTKKDNLYSSISTSVDDDDEYVIDDLNKNDFESDDKDVYQEIDELDDDDYSGDGLNQDDFNSDELDDEENLYQKINDLDDDNENLYQEIDELDDDIESNGVEETYNETESEEIEEYVDDETEEIDFDTSVLDDLDDYEEVNPKKKKVVVESEEADIDFNFDASVLDELDDYENPSTTKKTENSKSLSNTNMEPKSNKRFTTNSNNSGIGFRNKQTNSSDSIGFRKEEKSEETTIGFKRKSKTTKVEPEEEFNSDDFLNQMEENLKKTKTTSQTKKATTKKTTTTKRKKSE